MAHHLAEVLAEARDSTGPQKVDAEARAVELILRIWSHRRALPDRITPLGAYRKAIKVLERMMPDANPWIRRQSSGYEGLLAEMFDILGRATYAGLLLTSGSEPRQPTPEETAALDEEERRLLALLETWRSFSPQPGEAAERDRPDLHSAITEDLKRMQTLLADLTTRWRAKGPCQSSGR